MKLIVGLGNPGPKYTGTRHNVGFEVCDLLARRWGMDLSGENHHGWFALGQTGAERVALLKPMTFMNRSGQAVLAAGRFYKLETADLLVVVDDMALPIGQLRLRAGGSAGGHNGLKDIALRLGGEDWARLRIGVGEPFGEPASYVLSKFSKEEEPDIAIAVHRAADAGECWVKDGLTTAMNRFNGKVS